MINDSTLLVVETVRLLSNNILSKCKSNFIPQDVIDVCFNVYFYLCAQYPEGIGNNWASCLL